MKTSRIVILILTLVVSVLTTTPMIAGQKSTSGVTVPKYDPAVEATFKGTVEEGKRPRMPNERWHGLTPDHQVVSHPDD